MSDPRVEAYAAGLDRWRDEFTALRTILWDTELSETFKWYKPCYTHAGRNIAIFQPFNDRSALMFFKGALLDDPKGLLRAPSPEAMRGEAGSPLGITRSPSGSSG